DDALGAVAELRGLRGGDLDDQPASPFEGDPHDDAATLLHDLERTVTGARLHSSHRASLMCHCPCVAPPDGASDNAPTVAIISGLGTGAHVAHVAAAPGGRSRPRSDPSPPPPAAPRPARRPAGGG